MIHSDTSWQAILSSQSSGVCSWSSSPGLLLDSQQASGFCSRYDDADLTNENHNLERFYVSARKGSNGDLRAEV
eukprot:scaffold2000_cov48-Attheya_sp.AAC.6